MGITPRIHYGDSAVVVVLKMVVLILVYSGNQLQDNKNTSYLKTITSQQQHYHTDFTTRSNERQYSYKKVHNPLIRTKLERPTYRRNNIYLYILSF
jgi:murein tripeptide amidase MpaA